MSKDTTSRAADSIKDVVDDAKDAIHEVGHRTAADAEKARRESQADDMSTSEKVGSKANEIRHRTQAEIDKAKRDIRDHG